MKIITVFTLGLSLASINTFAAFDNRALGIGDMVFVQNNNQVGEVLAVGSKYIQYKPENGLRKKTVVKNVVYKQNAVNECIKSICVGDRVYDYFYNRDGVVTRTFGGRYVEYSYGIFGKRKIVAMKGDEKL